MVGPYIRACGAPLFSQSPRQSQDNKPCQPRPCALQLRGIFNHLVLFHLWNILMTWIVEVTDEFSVWFVALTPPVQDDIDHIVGLLEARGPQLPFPFSSGVSGSRHGHMRELRVQSGGEPYRIFYAFDPRRVAILLMGGCKTGDDRFYEEMIPRVDELYEIYLAELRKEGLL